MPAADPGPVRIELKGPGWWPEKGFDARPERLRMAYWNRLGELAVAAHRDQSRRGLGSDGTKLAKVKRRRGFYEGMTGPPLTPRYAISRTRRNLAFSKGKQGVTLWWRGGWGRVLGYHARRGGSFVKGAPVRDVIGLSPRAASRVRRQALSYWRNLTAPRKPVPAPAPVPASVPIPAPVPVLITPAPRGFLARLFAILARLFRRTSPAASPSPATPRPSRSRPAFLR